MKIIIVGAGRIGANLARSLANEKHEIFLIENNEEKARKVDEKLDVKVVVGSGSDPDTLKKVNVTDADLVVAVTLSDETNLVVCSLAEYFGAKRQIARVRNTSLSRELSEFGYEHFNIDEIINPEVVAAEAIVKTIETPGASEVADFADGRILLRGFDIPETSPLCGLKIEDFGDEDFPWPFLIIAINREHNAIIPSADRVIQANDHIYVLLPSASLGEFLSFVSPEVTKPEKVVIYGATNTGEHVAKTLSGKVRDLILIEEDANKAEHAAERLSGAKVIHGSPSEKDILTECGVEAADVFISASNNDHSNLVSAVLAKKIGARETVIITQQPHYLSIVDSLDIDVIINPHLLAVEQILSYVRGTIISSVRKLQECDAEAIELIPEAGAAITKAPLKGIKIPANSIIGAVYNDSTVSLAKGDTRIKEGERVIAFCQESDVPKLQALFAKK